MAREKSTVGDDDQLAAMGHQAELQRQFSPLAMLGLAFTILNTWTALSGSISLALPSGGTVTLIWGFLTAGMCNLCIAASLAEFLSAYPTAGGQYHWVAVIAPVKWRPLLSYITGWVNTVGWIALIGAGGLVGTQLIYGLVGLSHPEFAPQRWQTFLIYTAFNLFSFLVNAFGNKLLYLFNQFTIVWSIGGFLVITITALACAAPNFNSADVVFRLFTNETGWPDGVAWMLGLLQGSFSLTAYDSVAHMIEEIPNAAQEGPKIMIYAMLMGIFTGFIFLICMMFAGGNVSDVISSPYGPIIQILYTATSSKVAAVILTIIPIGCLTFATTSVQTTATRMTWAFARDRGIPYSRQFAKVHHGLGVPLNSLILTTVLVTIFGLIFLASSSAFNAIISAAVVALGVSYGIPIAINVGYRRRALPADRPFILPGPMGWICNIVGLVYTTVTTVLFLFPPGLPVTGSSMNYCIVAFAIVMVIAIAQWFIDGRKNYTGPQMDASHSVLVGVGGSDSSPMQTEYNTMGEKGIES